MASGVEAAVPSRKQMRAARGDTRRYSFAFTILELLIVISIIIVLAGLILATTGYVQKKGARSRAEAEIAAMSAACESYKADNGIYPNEDASTGLLNAQTTTDPSNYAAASLYLFKQLNGTNETFQQTAGAKNYFTFRPQMLGGIRDTNGNVTTVSFIRDPFGNSYGYSTMQATSGSGGYNPTFDLWSTGGVTTGTDQSQWIKNW